MASIPKGSQTRNTQLIANPITRLAIAEEIIAMRRVNGRRLKDIESLLLLHFALHCGAKLLDGWEISLEQLAGQYGKATPTLSTAIKTLLSEGLIFRRRVGRNPARYTLGRDFEEPIRLNENIKSKLSKT